MLNFINANCPNHWSKRVWLDVEGKDYWLGSYTKNQDWYEKLVDACKSKMSSISGHCGVYTSASQWNAIFGSGYKYANSPNALWYAYYDGVPSFDNFSPFGGWSSPHAKQFSGSTSKCGQGVDLNYSPNF
jgi:hypothetical protein